MNKEELAANADWFSVIKRPTWGCVSSAELAIILGVPFTSIGNWSLRGHLPEPEPRKKGKGNKNRYRISTIKLWLYGTSEEETHMSWIHEHMHKDIDSIEMGMWNASRCWRAFEIERVIL